MSQHKGQDRPTQANIAPRTRRSNSPEKSYNGQYFSGGGLNWSRTQLLQLQSAESCFPSPEQRENGKLFFFFRHRGKQSTCFDLDALTFRKGKLSLAQSASLLCIHSSGTTIFPVFCAGNKAQSSCTQLFFGAFRDIWIPFESMLKPSWLSCGHVILVLDSF